MAQQHRAAHLLAEFAALAAAFVLLLVSPRLSPPVQPYIRLIALFIILIDLFFLCSWRGRTRTPALVRLHVATEALGLGAGAALMLMAGEGPEGLASTYVFVLGLVMFLVDGCFLITWLQPGRSGRPVPKLPAAVRFKGQL